ncbi:MAG TPA: hypothetical protein DHV28_05345 [Ignavibacteriales bacterium]|nr:hypothetical protein [Ignavibacteriales bacterium]
MGQQQLLLIVLGVIVVGFAVVLAIILFRQNARDSKRDLLVNESANLANLALEYSKKPIMLGGGGNDFTNWEIPAGLKITASGTYQAFTYVDSVEIFGIGNEVVNGTDSIKVKVIVSSTGFRTEVIN